MVRTGQEAVRTLRSAILPRTKWRKPVRLPSPSRSTRRGWPRRSRSSCGKASPRPRARHFACGGRGDDLRRVRGGVALQILHQGCVQIRRDIALHWIWREPDDMQNGQPGAELLRQFKCEGGGLRRVLRKIGWSQNMDLQEGGKLGRDLTGESILPLYSSALAVHVENHLPSCLSRLKAGSKCRFPQFWEIRRAGNLT